MPDVTHKSVKQEDAVRTFGESAIDFLDLYWRRILIAVVVVVAVILVFWSNALATRASEARASKALSDLQQKMMESLSVQDREEAGKVLDSVVAGTKDLAGASTEAPAGREAVYLQGDALYLKGDYAEAATALEQYLSLAKTNDEKAKAQNALGLVAEDQLFANPADKELADRARKAYEAGLELGQDASKALTVYGRQAAMGLGRVAEILGDYDTAKAAYEKVVAAPSPADEEVVTQSKTSDEGGSREENADAIRKVLHTVETQYSYKRLAEQRLELLKARLETAKPDVHGTH